MNRDKIHTTIIAVDTAFKTKTMDDYSVFAVWGRSVKAVYLMDVYRAKLEYPDLLAKAKELYRIWNPIRMLVEDKASGQSLVQDLRRLLIPVIAVAADIDRYRRVSAVTGIMESGVCYFPESAPWFNDFLDEHIAFPNGEHDDQVDTTSIALAYFKASMAGGSGGKINSEKKEEGSKWRDR